MATTGHETESINVQGMKASLQKLKTDHIDTKYIKPSGGIPSADMTSAVQSSLGKADAAAPQSTTYTKTEVDAKIQTAITTRFAPTYVEQTKSLVFNINAPTYSPETKSLVFG